MTRLQSRLNSGILLGRHGDVHRDTGRGFTVCHMKVVNPVSVTDNQALVYDLGRCPKCWPAMASWSR